MDITVPWALHVHLRQRERCRSHGHLGGASSASSFKEPCHDNPARQFRLGFDDVGRLLELVVLQFDSGNELVIHAMKARPQYYDLLP
jgi:hypothetical protein